MSATLSEATGRPYGIQRVCQAWERSRSALYGPADTRAAAAQGRGARAAGSDAHGVGRDAAGGDSADLDRSPFQGEAIGRSTRGCGSWDGIRVARTRVLRVMRAHKLLSPHRGRQGTARVHAGTIVTQAPNVMWGTDGVRVFTLDDGWGWIFTAVEHWNAECVGWHVCKVGSRFAALEPIAQGLPGASMAPSTPTALEGWRCGWTTAASTCPTTFSTRFRYWGIRPSYGFVEEPETNGVAERWNRTLKEQATHGAHLPEPQGGTRRRDRVRGAVQHDLAAREARVSHADRGPRGARATPGGVALTCVQRTGCGTPPLLHRHARRAWPLRSSAL